MMRLIACCGLLFVVVAAVFAWPTMDERFAIQKIATDLAMPYAITWMGLLIGCVVSWRAQPRWGRYVWVTVLVIHTAAGNGVLSQYLALSLEKPYEDLEPLNEEPFDSIIVLGGGTGEARNGRAQTRGSGDRVVLAARMYHAGLAKQIVCTGGRGVAPAGGERLTPADEATEILTGLGVPAAKIRRMGGVNTADEMKNLARAIEPAKRVGLITSAWHMSRALRLAETQGIRLVPLPADFIADYQIVATARGMVPNSQAAADTNLLLHEYLARLVGR